MHLFERAIRWVAPVVECGFVPSKNSFATNVKAAVGEHAVGTRHNKLVRFGAILSNHVIVQRL